MVDAVALLDTASSAVGRVDPDGMTASELTDALLQMQRLRGQHDAAEARVLARWDADRIWQASGARSGAAWLAREQRLPIQTTRQRIRHARALRTLPAVEAAWASGEIDRTHLITLLGVRTPRTREQFDTDHKLLLDSARTRGFVDFKRHCDLWEAFVDPDGAEQGADDDRAAREVHLSQSFGGMWFGRMTLDPISGDIVHGTLSMIERELFEADWAQAKERLGRDPLIVDLQRTPAQRRADALVEMAIRARTAPANGKRPRPLFTVLVDYETFAGPLLELFNRTTITPGTAARWLDQADIERIVFDGPSRVIDVGAQRRFFRGALRRAIEVRDRTCFHPYCDEVPERLEIDHILDASKGGETTQDNAQGGCDFHNRWKYNHPDPGPDPPGLVCGCAAAKDVVMRSSCGSRG
ncbi:MAG: DUF222 domain-containing protein [Microthrixaceae bacterium]